jgi:hypothetical protein
VTLSLEERLAALEAEMAAHLEAAGSNPYRIATLELAVSEVVAAIQELIAALRPVRR